MNKISLHPSKNEDWRGLRKWGLKAATTRMKSLKTFYRIYNGVLQPATVLKLTGCFLVISEGAISMCLKKTNFIENLSVKLCHCRQKFTTSMTDTRHNDASPQTNFFGREFHFSIRIYIKIFCYAGFRSSRSVFSNIFWNFRRSILVELFQLKVICTRT